jgi:hypothetical protein
MMPLLTMVSISGTAARQVAVAVAARLPDGLVHLLDGGAHAVRKAAQLAVLFGLPGFLAADWRFPRRLTLCRETPGPARR